MTKTKSPAKAPSDSLNSILGLIKDQTEVDFSYYKMSTIRRRIERQMRLKKQTDLLKYLRYLRTHPESVTELYEDLFIHVTEFFRDPDAFESLKKNVFPALIKDKEKGDSLRVWVAGCSTGEEAYSLAIALTEFIKLKKISLKITVFATDISAHAIRFARRGIYNENAVSKITSKKILGHFEKTNDGYKVNKDIRDLCVFSVHDLTSDPPFSRLDLVTCRNVLIYFGTELQKKSLQMFNFGLKSDGFLWLGTSESILTSTDLYGVVDKKFRIFKKSENFIKPKKKVPQSARPSKKVTKNSTDAGQVQSEYLQSMFEQYETSQEELMSTNEELHASNQELHSANEELETAKEELQCTNEELMTTNEELEARNFDLQVANERIARSEERFRLMVTSVTDYAIFMLDPEGRITSWNEGAKRFKGYEADEVIGQHFSKFYTAPDIARNHPQFELKKAIEEGRYEEEGLRVRKDGSTFWANVVITRINDENGKLLGFSKVTRDLTERKKAGEELRKSEERFRLMVSSVKDYAIFMLDPDGRIASWNEGARRFKGYEASEIIGEHFRKFYTDADRARKHPEYELEVASKEGRYEEEGWRVRKDGTQFWANIVITRVLDDSGKILGYVKVTRDLTERRKNEEELRHAYEDLEKRVQERTLDLELALRSRDEFLSIASHELKTPLTSLRLQLQLANKRIALSDKEVPLHKELSKSLDIGVRQVTSLTHLVNDLLDISRIQTGVFELNRETFNLSELVDEISQRFKEQLENSRIPVSLHLDPEIQGNWDRYRLEQVIVNLISNVIKYAPQTPLEIITRTENGKAILEVVDQGPGIEVGMLDKIFHRFERGNSPQNVSGLGLGLFITKKIVEHHHGNVRVESAPGRGARFIVELPLQ